MFRVAPGCCTVEVMVDYDLLVASLQARGYKVDEVIRTASNAGDAELRVDGKLITLEEARKLLADTESR